MAKLTIINPATEEIIGELDEDTTSTLQEKYNRAVSAFESWKATQISERIKIVGKFKDLLLANLDSLAEVLTKEVGKPIGQSRNEIRAVTARIDFFLENVSSVLQEETVLRTLGGTEAALEEKISYDPLGVIANISAWNYPYFVGSNVFIPALLTGNTVLYKPSEFASLTGLEIADLFYRAGLPRDVFIPVIGGGRTGAELLKLPVNGVYFTGSVGTGLKIAESLGGRLIRLQMELGGKDPAYVCDDVDIKTAAESLADGAFYNTGQSCCSVERIYVHKSVYGSFMDHFMKTVNSFKLGDPEDASTYIGPVTRSAQILQIKSQIRDAVSKGAKLLTGGDRADRKGFYLEPTVLADVNHSMEVMREESFGPVIGIMQVSSDEEATRLMNETTYGLTAGVYSSNRSRAEKILSKIDAGTVYWNCCDRVSPRLPWTGRKHSGIGSTLSRIGIQAFVQPRAWHLRSPS